jgi:hypothetical protein
MGKKKGAEAPLKSVTAIAPVIPISTAVSAMISMTVTIASDAITAVPIAGRGADTPVRAANQRNTLNV